MWKRDDLEQGNAEDPVATLSLPPSMPENFTFTPDGKALLGNSYYTGVSNVFRFDIATGKYDVLTNAATGLFRPQLRPDGSLLVYDYTGEGFNPSIVQPEVREDLAAVRFLGTEVVNERPELKQWGMGSPAKIPLDELITPARHLRPDQAHAVRRALSDRLGLRPQGGVRLLFPHRRPAAVPPAERQRRRLALGVHGCERLHLNVEFRRPTGSSPTGTISPTFTISPDRCCAAARATRSSPLTKP